MTAEMRESFGRRVREIWMEWASEQPEPKPQWLDEWEDLPEEIREVDRRIGEGIKDLTIEEIKKVFGPDFVEVVESAFKG